MPVQGDTDLAVAYSLLHDIARAESKNIAGGGNQTTKQWILDTYAECLKVVRQPSAHLKQQP